MIHGSVCKRKVIMAFNKEIWFEIDHLMKRDQYAKRCRVAQVDSDFIINVNIVNNIQINNLNHIYNN